MNPFAHQITKPYQYGNKKEMPESISVVTGSYNYSHFLRHLIYRMTKVQVALPKKYEIVIADTGSTTEDQEKMLALMEEYRGVVNIKYVMHNKNDIRGSIPHFHAWSFGVNAAFNAAENDVVIYCDSSILVPEDFVLSLGSPHVRHDKLFTRCATYNYNMKETEVSIQEEMYKRPWNEIWALLSKKKSSLGRSGWSVKRKELLDVRGADVRFTHYGCHDDDLIMRMMMNGCRNMSSDTKAVHQSHSDTDRNARDKYNEKILIQNVRGKVIRPNTQADFERYDWIKTNF